MVLLSAQWLMRGHRLDLALALALAFAFTLAFALAFAFAFAGRDKRTLRPTTSWQHGRAPCWPEQRALGCGGRETFMAVGANRCIRTAR